MSYRIVLWFYCPIECVVHGTPRSHVLKQLYSTPGPVSTWMGDCLRASQYEASQLGRLSLLRSVGW